MVTVNFNSRSVEKALGELSNQAPFALQKAINDTLVDVQKGQISHINDVFTIRRQRFLKNSIKIKFAKKTDLVGFVRIADVGSTSSADIFNKFETGGAKKARGQHIAIPMSNVKASKSGVITKSNRPSALKNSFMMETSSGNKFIVQSKRKKGKDELKFMYTLKQTVRIDNRLRFVDTGLQIVKSRASINLNIAMERAVRTAKLS